MIPLGLYDLICLWQSLILTLEKLDFWSQTLVKITKFFFDAHIITNISLTRKKEKKERKKNEILAKNANDT